MAKMGARESMTMTPIEYSCRSCDNKTTDLALLHSEWRVCRVEAPPAAGQIRRQLHAAYACSVKCLVKWVASLEEPQS